MLDNNDKYAAIALSETGCSIEIDQPIILPDGFVVSSKIPFEITPWWKEQLGEIQCRELEKAELFFITHAKGNSVKVVDDENNSLISKCMDFLSAVQLTGSFRYGADSRVVSGASEDGIITFRKILPIPEATIISGTILESFGLDRAKQSYEIYSSFSKFIKTQDEDSRIFWAVNCFLDGLCARHVYDKIGNFIRAIEAFILPEDGKTKSQFKSRTELFIGTGKHALIEELYSVRSAIMHLHNPLEIINGNSKTEKFKRLLELGLVAESIARHCLSRFAVNEKLWKHFSEDENIALFWTLNKKEQAELWGQTFDVKKVKNYFDPRGVKFRERLK